MIVIKHSGNFKNLEKFLDKNKTNEHFRKILDKYGAKGVDLLSKNTPVDSGETANAWGYKTSITKSGFGITFTNDNIVNGVPIAIIIQYGHGTKNGGYVTGIDYINPALKPIFNSIANEVWAEVISN